MTTLLELTEGIARALRDPDGKTFEPDTLRDLVNSALAELSRIDPLEKAETITPVLDTFSYATTITEPVRVEVWTLNPVRHYTTLRPSAPEYANSSETGWDVWAGSLRLPYSAVDMLDPATYELRLWGYGPRLHLTELTDIAEVDEDGHWAVHEYAVLQGYERLASDRMLFTQWQTGQNATDTSMAGVLNAVSIWTQKWERRRKQLTQLRRSP